ncbi:MAG: 5'-nucleotidase C-terminal domain-containing protein [Pyrinomonadaceae bacterium]
MRHAIEHRRGIVAAIILSCCFFGAFDARAQQPSPRQGTNVARPTNVNRAQRPSATQSATSNASRAIPAQATERAVDASIPTDPSVDKLLAPYSVKVRELNNVIGTLKGDLKKEGIGAGSLGNFVADAMRASAERELGKPVLLAITNSGGLRKNDIAAGDIRASDIYQLLPFENSLIALDLTGEQLRRFFDIIVAHRDAQSGAVINYRTNAAKQSEITTVKLGTPLAPKEIDPKALYTIVTIDYLVKRGGDYSLLREAKNARPLNLTLRDAVLAYVKAETAAKRPITATLDNRFHFEGGDKDVSEGAQP